jgi:hypothetical protein
MEAAMRGQRPKPGNYLSYIGANAKNPELNE